MKKSQTGLVVGLFFLVLVFFLGRKKIVETIKPTFDWFEKNLLPKTLKFEGGFVNDPADPGKATNLGVSWNVFLRWAERLGLPATIDGLKKLTPALAAKIYWNDYFTISGADRVKDARVAHMVYDSFVNTGYGCMHKFQKAFGIAKSSKVDNVYLSHLNAADSDRVFALLKSARIEYYNNLVKQKPSLAKFLKGWLKRTNQI